jgi:hypothetical protein
MDKNQSPRRKGLFDMRDVKRLVFVLALSSTLGFWALFSNKINLSSSTAASSSVTAVADPPTQAVELIVLELQPIPTLIPTAGAFAIPTSAPAAAPTPTSSAPVHIVINAPPASSGNTRKSFGNDNQGRSNQPAPVTTTRTSQ